MLEILACAAMAAVAGLACWGITTIVERTAPKETDEPQCVLLDTPEGLRAASPDQLCLPERFFKITVTQYIRTGEVVNIRFTLPEPGSWDTLEQSDAWRRFQQAVKEAQ